MITPVPLDKQPGSPGGRLVTGRWLNRVVEALRARTPLNAAQSTPAGYSGAAKNGGAPPPKQATRGRYDPDRTYVLSAGWFDKLQADLRARTPLDEASRVSGGFAGSARGIRAALRCMDWISPEVVSATMPAGFRMPAPLDLVARLRIEVETKLVRADMCALSKDWEAGEFVTKETTVSTYEHGVVTNTVTAGGNIRTWAEGAEPDECAAPVYASDRDDEVEYGDFLSSDYHEDRTAFSTVWDAAIAALPDVAATAVADEWAWPKSLWPSVSAPGGFDGYSLGSYGVGSVLALESLFADTSRWRAHNLGNCDIELVWDLLDSANVSTGTDSLVLRAGATSDWQPAPTLDSDPANRRVLTLSAVHLGPYH